MKAGQLWRKGREMLAPSPDADWDARQLLCDELGIERTQLAMHLFAEVDEAAEAAFLAAVRRRAAGEPLQYIRGRVDFGGVTLRVDERVLIPRQDTESLALAALAHLAILHGEESPKQILDLCTGSGAVIIDIAKTCETEDFAYAAADISGDALCLARENARQNGVKVEFWQGDLFAAVPEGRRFDIITCNPPYLSRTDMEDLQNEVRREPALALYGGEDGLDFYRRLAREAMEYLRPGGYLILEIGSTQAAAVRQIFSAWNTQVFQDLNGLDRVVAADLYGKGEGGAAWST